MTIRYKFLLIVLLIQNIACLGVDLAAHRISQQRKTEAQLRKQEEEILILLIEARKFTQAAQVYRTSERVRYKNKTMVEKLLPSLVCLAAYFGDIKIINLLFESGLPVDQKDIQGNTPLIWAAHIGNHELVLRLLGLGADVTVQNKRGLTALDFAFRLKQGRAALALVEGYIKKELDKQWKPVPWCIYHGHKELARLLIDTPLVSVPVDDVDGKGNTGLMWAVLNNDRKAVKLLLSKGASANKLNRDGNTPMSLVLQANDMELIYLFAEQAAKQEEKNITRYGPLAWAVRHDDVYLVRKLLKHERTSVEAQDQAGNTPLMWAVIEGRHVIARMLIRAGAQVTTKNKVGQTPVSIAAQKGDSAMLATVSTQEKALQDKNEFGWTVLITAARYGHTETVQALLDQGVSVQEKDNDGNSALYWAARFGHEPVVRLLLKAGVPVNEPNEFGWTPIYWAARNKHARVVRLLLEHGAQLDPSLDYGAIMPYCKGTQALKALFKRGEQS